MFVVFSYSNDCYYFHGVHEGTEEEIAAKFDHLEGITFLAWGDRKETTVESVRTPTIIVPKDPDAKKPEAVLDKEAELQEEVIEAEVLEAEAEPK